MAKVASVCVCVRERKLHINMQGKNEWKIGEKGAFWEVLAHYQKSKSLLNEPKPKTKRTKLVVSMENISIFTLVRFSLPLPIFPSFFTCIFFSFFIIFHFPAPLYCCFSWVARVWGDPATLSRAKIEQFYKILERSREQQKT